MKKLFFVLLGLGSSLPGISQVTSTSQAPIGPNLALGKLASASSVEGPSFAAKFAFDADYRSRWASDRTNPATIDTQWLAVDLGATYTITKVRVNWQTAYGKDYQIQVSNDGKTWTPVRSVAGNKAFVNLLSGLSAKAQYVRLYNTARGTGYGYSVYELEVSASNAAPTVQLTQPAANSSYTGAINLSADATDDDGAVSKVDFYVDNVLVGSDNTAPYTATWPTTSNGTHVAKAVATDDNGATATSYEREFYTSNPTTAPNAAPSVTLTQPIVNRTYYNTLDLAADASDPDGTVSKVDFYVDNVLVGTDATAPYAATWPTPTAGTHVAKAVATDDKGLATTSETVEFIQALAAGKRVPGKVEAESFDAQSGTITEATTDADGGQDVRAIEAGDYLNYKLVSAANDYYTVQLRVASTTDGAQLVLQRLGDGVAFLATVPVPNTGGSQNWKTVTITDVGLPTGPFTLRVAGSAGSVSLNWLSFTRQNGQQTTARLASPSAVAAPTPPAAELSAYPNPSTGLVRLTAAEEGAPVRIMDLNGTVVLTTTVRNKALDLSKLASGTYMALFQQNGKPVRLKLNKQ